MEDQRMRWYVLFAVVVFGAVCYASTRPTPAPPPDRLVAVLDGPCAKVQFSCGDGRQVTQLRDALRCQEFVFRCDLEGE